MKNRNNKPIINNKRKRNAPTLFNHTHENDAWPSTSVNHNKSPKLDLSSIVDTSCVKHVLKINPLNSNLQQPLNWFESKDSFTESCQKLNGIYSIIPQFILNHTIAENHKNVSWITWSQDKFPKDNMYLKLEITTFKFKDTPVSTDYHSWMFSEAGFLNLHSYTYTPGSQSYYRLEVYEEHYSDSADINFPPLNSSYKILVVWFSLNASFGELLDLKKGQALSGTEVMSAFEFLNENLLKIQTMYLCDSSRANGSISEDATGQIVFRVLMSVAYGSTWYEKCGYEAFEFENLQQGWPGGTYALSQDPQKYYGARKELMKMSVSNLYDTFLSLEAKIKDRKYLVLKSNILSELCSKYCKHHSSSEKSNKTGTLSALISAVYAEFKISKDDTDLTKAYSLLTIPNKYLPMNASTPNYYKLLTCIVDTRFFRKKTNQLKIDAGEKKQTSLHLKF